MGRDQAHGPHGPRPGPKKALGPGATIYYIYIYTTYTTTYTIPYHPGGGPPGLGAQGAASNMDMKSKQGKNDKNKQKLIDFSQNVSKTVRFVHHILHHLLTILIPRGARVCEGWGLLLTVLH